VEGRNYIQKEENVIKKKKDITSGYNYKFNHPKIENMLNEITEEILDWCKDKTSSGIKRAHLREKMISLKDKKNKLSPDDIDKKMAEYKKRYLENCDELILKYYKEGILPKKVRILDKKEQESLLEDYRKIQKESEQWIKDLSKSSYYEKKPTDFKDEEKHRKIKTFNIGGTDWGSAVHKILDYLIKKNPNLKLLSLYIEKSLEKQGISLERKVELEKIVQKFKKSDLCLRLKKTESKYSEVPFTAKIKPGHPLYAKLAGQDSYPVILSGTIDLVFKEVDGWVVVDYKTDCPENKNDYPELTKVYQTQIDIYRQVWQEISREKVKQSFIYFL